MAANALQNLVREMEQRYSIMSLAKTRSLIELNRVARQARRAGAAVHPVRHRRARRPHDGRAGRRRGLDHPPRAEGARGRHPPRARDAVAARRRHHRHDQGERPVADRVQRVVADRLARDPRPERRRVAARPGRHAVLAGRHVAAAAHPGRVHRRAADRGADDVLAHARASRSCARTCSTRSRPRTRRPSTRRRDDGFSPDEDPLLEDAIRLVVEMGTASTSMLQRRLRLGYTRAGRLIDMLERRDVISGYEGSKPRQVLVGAGDVERFIANLRERRPGGADGAVAEAVRRARRSRPGRTSSLWRRCRTSGPRCARRACARGSTSPRSRRETKIRAKYLRALENEEWDLLPGPTYVKSFLRTYAEALDLDAQAARRRVQAAPRAPERGRAAADQRRRAGARAPASGAGRAALDRRCCVIFVALIVTLDLLRRDDDEPAAGGDDAAATTQTTPRAAATADRRRRAAPQRVRLRIVATGQVYVCLKAGEPHARRRPDARRPAQRTRTFRSRRFRLTLGNAGVRLRINGRVARGRRRRPSRSGCEITPRGGRQPLSAGQRAPSAARERPRRDRRHRHRGADRARVGSQRPVAVRPAAGAGRRHRGDRRRRRPPGGDPARRCDSWRREGCALIVHERRARADGRRPDGGGRRALPGSRDGARRAARRAHRGDPAAADVALAGPRSARPCCVSNRKQAVIPSGAAILEPVGTAPGLVVTPAARRRGRRSSCCPGRRASCSRCGRRRVDDAGGARGAWPGAVAYRRSMLRLFGIPESEIAATLRAAAADGRRARAPGDHDLPAARRGRGRHALRAADGAVYERARGVRARRGTPTRCSPTTAATVDQQVFALLRSAGRDDRGRRVVHRRPAGGAADRPAGVVGGRAAAGSSCTPTRRRSALAGVDPALIASHRSGLGGGRGGARRRRAGGARRRRGGGRDGHRRARRREPGASRSGSCGCRSRTATGAG